MKQPLFPLAMILIVFVVWSCRKNLLESTTNLDQPLSVEIAKEDYKNALRESRYIAGSIVHPDKNMSLMWSAAYSSRRDSTEYVEAPISADRKRIAFYNFPADQLKSEPDEVVGQWTIQRMLFYRNPGGEIQKRIVTYIPDKEYILRRKSEINLNSIRKLQSNFKGYIEYRNWQNQVTVVLRIVDGRVVRRYRPQQTTTAARVRPMALICIDKCTPVYELVCESTPEPEFPGAGTCDWEMVDEICVPWCYDTGEPDPDPYPEPDPEPEPDPDPPVRERDCAGVIGGSAYMAD